MGTREGMYARGRLVYTSFSLFTALNEDIEGASLAEEAVILNLDPVDGRLRAERNKTTRAANGC